MADAATRKQKVPIKPVPDNSGWYNVMAELIEKHHPHLTGESADIILMWHLTKKADSDGILTPAWAKKTTELERQREAAGRDFVIFLCHDVFNSGDFTEDQGRFWLDMALESCKPQLKENGEQKLTEDNEYVWRIAKPPVAVFPEVIARHGPLHDAVALLRRIILDNVDRDRTLLRLIGDREASSEDDRSDEELQRDAEDEAVADVFDEEPAGV